MGLCEKDPFFDQQFSGFSWSPLLSKPLLGNPPVNIQQFYMNFTHIFTRIWRFDGNLALYLSAIYHWKDWLKSEYFSQSPIFMSNILFDIRKTWLPLSGIYLFFGDFLHLLSQKSPWISLFRIFSYLRWRDVTLPTGRYAIPTVPSGRYTIHNKYGGNVFLWIPYIPVGILQGGVYLLLYIAVNIELHKSGDKMESEWQPWNGNIEESILRSFLAIAERTKKEQCAHQNYILCYWSDQASNQLTTNQFVFHTSTYFYNQPKVNIIFYTQQMARRKHGSTWNVGTVEQ